MNVPSLERVLVLSVVLAATFCFPAAGSASDYYSWIDANGTMVMTDDPSRVPPPTSRSQVQVHRFEPAAPGPAAAREAEPTVHEETPTAAPVDPRHLDLPTVLLDEPERQVRSQYVWVPLLSPLFVGGNTVNGFWWHSGSTSPVEAFKHYLAQYYREQRGQWSPGVGVPYPSYHPNAARSTSGNPVFDQVVRERQALEESIRLRLPGTPASGQPVSRGGGGVVLGGGGGGSHSIRTR
jgi:hypothetical protein